MSLRADASAAAATAAATIEHRVGREVVWRAGDVDRLVYHYATDRRKPFIHPLRSSSGAVLTALEPDDHPWHRGVWFAWKFLNGINVWEETGHAGIDMARNGAANTKFGHTELTSVDEAVWQPQCTRITTQYHYLDPQGTILLRELRKLRLRLPADGSCVIDWDATFTADEQPVRIDRTVISPETPWGGYAGLSFRAAETWRDVQGIDSDGRRNTEIEHQRARWVHITGVGEEGQRVGLAMLDHPDNPRYPSYWRYIDQPGFAYINPSLVLAEPYDLAAGAALQLRYRIVALEGGLNAPALEDQHAAFTRGFDAPEGVVEGSIA